MTTPPETKTVHHLILTASPSAKRSPLSEPPRAAPTSLPKPREVKHHNSAPLSNDMGVEKARLAFVGTATCVLEWAGVRVMTDPNFLHAGDHVHLGPGVMGTRKTDPAFPIEELPPIDAVVLSHFHADHFDQLVQEKLRKDLPIVTTKHAEEHLAEASLGFTKVYGMNVWESTLMRVVNDLESPAEEIGKADVPCIRVTATPGKHIAGAIGAINDAILHAIPPTNGHIVELGYHKGPAGGDVNSLDVSYRIYISGDTLMVDDLKEIPQRYPNIDLLLIHLGGTSIPGPHAPILMVTMDDKQGIQLVKLVGPKLTIPIHFDDYDVFVSPRSDFEKEVTDAGLDSEVLYLERGDVFEFGVRRSRVG
ncbi:hypothetical protein NliqN6_5070 [Naganishia liquefaciens]|uniref:Metallo-beta-lactamase domain-containing protein n=1 Tax=Naganishia liquefaciens TaxID=104408 RepID=A0A8H3TXJ4_9TREE|nr:hypothetical protein NliqN6_5070 [Naganishia liquefaciens]